MIEDKGKSSEAPSLIEVAENLRASREVLAAVELEAVAGTARGLAETVDVLAGTVERLYEMLGVEWMDADQAARYLEIKSTESFEKTGVKEGLPRHYFSRRLIRYNRAELDAWLMARSSPPGS